MWAGDGEWEGGMCCVGWTWWTWGGIGWSGQVGVKIVCTYGSASIVSIYISLSVGESSRSIQSPYRLLFPKQPSPPPPSPPFLPPK